MSNIDHNIPWTRIFAKHLVLFHPELSITLPGNIISSPKVLFLSDQEYKQHFILKGKGLEIKCTHIKYTQTYIFSQARCIVHVQTKIKMYIYNQENLWPGLKHSKYFLPWPKGCCIFCLHFVVIIWKYLRHMEWALRALSCFL